MLYCVKFLGASTPSKRKVVVLSFWHLIYINCLSLLRAHCEHAHLSCWKWSERVLFSETLSLTRQHHFAREFHNSWRFCIHSKLLFQLNKSCIKLCDRLMIALLDITDVCLCWFSLPHGGSAKKMKRNVREKEK